MNYGLSYQGSKGKIFPHISALIPNAKHFYDLFGGGFAATHYMMSRRKNSFQQFHYNEIRQGMCSLIKDAIDGKYNYNHYKPEWISRENFEQNKDSNPYIKIVWSFGNNGKNYLFGKDIEQYKKSMHMAVVFDEFDYLFIKTFKFKIWPKTLTSIKGKRLFLKEINRRLRHGNRSELQRLQQLQQLERLQQLQQLQQLERLQQLEQLEQKINLTNLDYKNVHIEKDSVIYCDPPYKNTAEYDSKFDCDNFFNWAHEQENPVFISEYNIDDKRFKLIKKIAHRSTLSSDVNNQTIEKVYCNLAAWNKLKEY